MERPENQPVFRRLFHESRNILDIKDQLDLRLTRTLAFCGRMKKKRGSVTRWHKLGDAVALATALAVAKMIAVKGDHLRHLPCVENEATERRRHRARGWAAS